MNLSNALLLNVSNKLKLNTSVLEEKNYNVNLSNLISVLSDFDDDTKFKLIWKREVTSNNESVMVAQDFVIMYIITVTFLKSNTMIHVSDTVGNIKWFCSSGSVHITGKRKKQRRSVILKLILLLFKQTRFLFKTPVALHLNNASSYQTFIINKLKKEIYIKIIKSFNQTPYNGCRKKKIRRKKYSKTFK